jgi:hypothetical protein
MFKINQVQIGSNRNIISLTLAVPNWSFTGFPGGLTTAFGRNQCSPVRPVALQPGALRQAEGLATAGRPTQ